VDRCRKLAAGSMSLSECSRDFPAQVLKESRGLLGGLFSAHQFMQDVFLR